MIVNFNELKRILDYKDNRSVTKWCLKQGVTIFTDEGSNIKYVLKAEVESVRYKKVYKYLKEKYGEVRFSEVLQAHFNLFSSVESVKDLHKRYPSCGKEETNFLSLLTNLTPEL